MESAGLAAGLISLASLFNAVVDDFEYIRFGRTFGQDFQSNLLQLDNARLRLSRWGAAIGLSDVDENVKSLRGTKLSEEDMPQVERLLGQILSEIERIEKLSVAYTVGKNPSDKSLAVYNEEDDMDPVGVSLHQISRRLSKKRQNTLPIQKKVKWALYHRGHFKEMIEKIKDLTNELVELFPAAKGQQASLRDMEIFEFGESFRVLKDAIEQQDKLLASAISAVLQPVSEKNDFAVYGGTVGVQQARNDGTISQSFH